MEEGFNPYTENFTNVYNVFWNDFIEKYGPKIYDLFKKKAGSPINYYLDVGCGTGKLIELFNSKNINSWGIDNSKSMLKIAEERLKNEITAGKVKLIQQDASDFHLDFKFDAITSTFDTINHLDNLSDVEKCFRLVKTHLNESGMFLFDVNTATTLRNWNFIEVEETDDKSIVYIMQGKYENAWNKAYSRVSGFIKNQNNEFYSRFDEVYYNTIFKIEDINDLLKQIGFSNIETYDEDFRLITGDPEECERVFILAMIE